MDLYKRIRRLDPFGVSSGESKRVSREQGRRQHGGDGDNEFFHIILM
jgi:hypothetical protein